MRVNHIIYSYLSKMIYSNIDQEGTSTSKVPILIIIYIL